MEFIKSFLKLPESERQKVHEAILLLENAGSLGTASTSAAEPDSSINSSTDLLGLFKGIPIKHPPNQKTLDKWIVKKKPPQSTNIQTSDIEKISTSIEEVQPNLQNNSTSSSNISNFKEYDEEHLISEVHKKELKVLIKRQECLETSKCENKSSVVRSTEFLCDVSDSISSNNSPVSEVNKEADIIESSEHENLLPLKQKIDNDSQLPERSYNLRSARRVSDDKCKVDVRTLNSLSNNKESSSVLNDNSECEDVYQAPVKSNPKIKSNLKNFLGKKVAHVEEKNSIADLNVCSTDININSKVNSCFDKDNGKDVLNSVKKKMKTVSSGSRSKKNQILKVDTPENIPKQDFKKMKNKPMPEKELSIEVNPNSCLKINAKTEDLHQLDKDKSKNLIESVSSSYSIECDSDENFSVDSMKSAVVRYSKKKVLKKKCRKMHDTIKSTTPIKTNNESSTFDNEESAQASNINMIEMPTAEEKDGNHISDNTITKIKIAKEIPSGKKVFRSKKIKINSTLYFKHSSQNGEEEETEDIAKLDKDILKQSEMKDQRHLQISSAHIDSNFINEMNIPKEQVILEKSSSFPEKRKVKSCSEKIKKKNDPENLVSSLEIPTSGNEDKSIDVNVINSLTIEEIVPSEEQNCENILQKILNDNSDSIEESSELIDIACEKESLKRKKPIQLSSEHKVKPLKRKKSDKTFENNSAAMKIESKKSVKVSNVKKRNSKKTPVTSNRKITTKYNEESPESCMEQSIKNKLQPSMTDLVIPSSVSEPSLGKTISNTENKSKNKKSHVSKASKGQKKNNVKELDIANGKNTSCSEFQQESINIEIPTTEQTCNFSLSEINDDLKSTKNGLSESIGSKEKTCLNLPHNSIELDEEMNRNYAAFCTMSKILETLKIDIRELFQNQKMENSLKHISEGIFIIKKYNLDIKNSVNIYMHESKEELKQILQNLHDK